jgi:hypothetical protein
MKTRIKCVTPVWTSGLRKCGSPKRSKMTESKPERYEVDPRVLIPPHKITNVQKARQLCAEFRATGWDPSEPALVGYWWMGKIQLLSGTHRRAGAMLARIAVPVVVYDRAYVEDAWGTDRWAEIMMSGVGRAVV